MNNKTIWGTLAVGIILLSGIVGVLLSINNSSPKNSESSYDELSDEMLGI